MLVGIGILAGYWAFLTFVPIRDVRLTKADLVARADAAGDVVTAERFNAPGNCHMSFRHF